ncbi:MAG: lytic murein transglycosylase [Desulfobacteraceae bacterium]|nr:MAG: lytic murein transglycosylase [Desulfobacteraceae bacterium]
MHGAFLLTKKYLSLSGFLFVIAFFSPGQGVSADFNYFEPLQKKLISEGFDRNKISGIYCSPRMRFDTKGVSMFFVHREAGLNYKQYPSTLSVVGARIYMQKYAKELSEAKEKYGVDRSIITAIILVESKFGKTLGKRSVLNTLSTMASLFDPDIRSRFWNEISGETTLSRDEFEKKALKKSGWAYRELKSFLIYTERERIDPLKITGSYAGAMGIPQFVPSNIMAYATDGNMDGCIDLFEHADAIASIANFLKESGWYPGITVDKAEKVIRMYNPSCYYIDAILKVAEMLKG